MGRLGLMGLLQCHAIKAILELRSLCSLFVIPSTWPLMWARETFPNLRHTSKHKMKTLTVFSRLCSSQGSKKKKYPVLLPSTSFPARVEGEKRVKLDEQVGFLHLQRWTKRWLLGCEKFMPGHCQAVA